MEATSICDHVRLHLRPGSDGTSASVRVPLYFDTKTGKSIDPSIDDPSRTSRALIVSFSVARNPSALMAWEPDPYADIRPFRMRK